MTPFLLLAAAAGGAIGAALRLAVVLASMRAFGTEFPWGTMIVNVAGSLIMGLLIGYMALKSPGSEMWRTFLATGVLGGFTTFSAFSLDFALLWERKAHLAALGYAAGSVLLSLAAVFIGLAAARAIWQG
jgi:CrcB protein